MEPTNKSKAKLVQQRAKFSNLEDMVRLQFILLAFTRDIHLTEGDFCLLTHVAIHGYDVRATPRELVAKKKFLHLQSVRNTRNKLVEMGLLVMPQKRHYVLNPELNIQSEGVIMLEFKAMNR